MNESKCNLCGAELLPATSFCRQCGSAITDTNAANRSEAPTANFANTVDNATTKRLHPRPTSPGRGLAPMVAENSTSSRRGLAVMGSVVVLILVGILTTVVVMRTRNSNVSADGRALIYPGAETVVDIPNTDGSRTIQFRTKDPLARVENWYQSNLKLSKTMRLTSASVVMKKDKVTITLAEEDNTTNILIKQAP